MGFVVDFSQFEKLVKDMKASEKDFEDFLYKFLLRMGNEVLKQTKKNTPVDTGALKSSWSIQKSKVSSRTETRTHTSKKSKMYGKQSDVDIFSQSGRVITSGKGKEISIVISNPQEYATEVEFGRVLTKNGVEVGWKDGRFMLTTSIENVQRQMPSAYEMEFNKFCRSHGIA